MLSHVRPEKRREWFATHFGRTYFRSSINRHEPLLIAVAIVSTLCVGMIALALFAGLMPDLTIPIFFLAPMKDLVDKRKQLEEKQKVLGKIFEDAGKDIDLTKVAIAGCSTNIEKIAAIRKMNDELNDLGKEVEALAAVERAEGEQKKRQIEAESTQRSGSSDAMIHPDGKAGQPQVKGFGRLFLESDVWKSRKHPGVVGTLPDFEVKVLFQTSAGWSPESLRTGRVVDIAARPIRMIDVLPMGNTTMAAVVYMEETTATFNAAEAAEGAVYAESAFALTQRTETIRKVATSIPVTDEQLEDVTQAEGYLDRRLRYDLLRRVDGQVLTGSGVAPNLLGILNKAGIQTQAKGVDSTPTAIRKAITLVRAVGFAEPNVVVLHPNDWQDIAILTDANGNYIFGPPGMVIEPRIWGLPIVETTAETENTGLLGDFANFSELVTRKGVEVQIGFVNDDFTRGQKRIRADFRLVAIWYRAAAFCTITGI